MPNLCFGYVDRNDLIYLTREHKTIDHIQTKNLYNANKL